MNFYGIQKTSLLDFPGHMAAILFTGGCNFNCPYCHNASLLKAKKEDALDNEEIFSFLKKRASILEGIVITGGEPTIHKDLPDMIRKLKSFGYKIKLDTNGSNPAMLKKLLSEKLLDYVAMDVKAAFSEYEKTISASCDQTAIKESISLFMESDLPHEFRITCVRELQSPDSFHEIGHMLKGAGLCYLQNFKDSDAVRFSGLHPFSEEGLKKAAEILQLYVHEVKIR